MKQTFGYQAKARQFFVVLFAHLYNPVVFNGNRVF